MIKPIFRFAGFCGCMLMVFSCVSGGAVPKTEQPAYSADSLTLDAAIAGAAVYFIGQLPTGAKMAILPFDAPGGRLADYVFEELWTHFEDSRNFVMVDRRNLERIEAEIRHQYQSGKVDDALMVSMSKQYGAEIVVYGHITPLGSEYRLTVYASDVEKALSSQRAFTVRPDTRLAVLINTSLDGEMEQVVQAMAQALNQRTVIAVGRISYADTQTVTGLSAWLKNSFIIEAQKRRDKFQIASDANSTTQAVVSGNYAPLDNGAEVSLQLISASENRVVLASQRFFISAAELERRHLSLLGEQGNDVITQAEFERKQQAIVPYGGKNNTWVFTVSADVLDGIYHDGDDMTMRLYSERDCYFRIIHVDVNGSAQVIYPTSANDHNFIGAGQTRRIPDNTRYRLSAPFGEEIILAAAYDRPFTPGQFPGAIPLSAEAITRSLSAESGTHTTISPSATAQFSYTILPR